MGMGTGRGGLFAGVEYAPLSLVDQGLALILLATRRVDRVTPYMGDHWLAQTRKVFAGFGTFVDRWRRRVSTLSSHTLPPLFCS